jgi:hypothetical protein
LYFNEAYHVATFKKYGLDIYLGPFSFLHSP